MIEILVRIAIANPGPEAASIHVLPTVWFRNTWSWGQKGVTKPQLHAASLDRHVYDLVVPAVEG